MNSPLISKSNYLNGVQCHKLLWFCYNDKDKIPPPGKVAQARFNQGKLVGEYAKKLYQGGIQIEDDPQTFSALKAASSIALRNRKPVFEGGFVHKNAFVRTDILNPVNKDQWDIVEVKSSTEVKDEHIPDLSIQRYVCDGVGLKIRKCYIMHINNQYVRRGEINLNELFTLVDITDQVAAMMPLIEQNLQAMAGTINLVKCPDIPIGAYCDDPYECPLHEMCWAFLPDNHVLTFYRFPKEKGFGLIQKGFLDVRDIPGDVKLNDKHKIQIEAIRTGRAHVDRTAIRDFLDMLEYPVHFLDFETFDTPVPLFDLTRPYQKVPFQYSLYILRSREAESQHYSFLADGSADPRPEIMSQLQKFLGTKGSIVVYNATFEKTVLKYVLESYPLYKDWYANIEFRFVDLLKPFSSFHYYHPLQRGSASIKAVLPALTGSSYQGMEISDGEVASAEYLRVTLGSVSDEERLRVRKQLEEYCKLDSLGMVKIVQKLRELIS